MLLLALTVLAVLMYVMMSLAQEPRAAELSEKETVASAFLRGFKYQEYEVRSAAEAMPEDKYSFRRTQLFGMFKNQKPEFGPAEVRTFAEQVKHVACSNFAFAAEFDGTKPPERCDMGGPSPARPKSELLTYLRSTRSLPLRRALRPSTRKTCLTQSRGHMPRQLRG